MDVVGLCTDTNVIANDQSVPIKMRGDIEMYMKKRNVHWKMRRLRILGQNSNVDEASSFGA